MVWGPGQYRPAASSQATYGPLEGASAHSAEYREANPVLPLGYIGYESDTGRVKIGDGISDWNTLEY